MKAREAMLHSDLFGDDIKKLFPIINENGSDSAMFDNCLEFLALSGRALPHAMMMMIPSRGRAREHERREEGILRIPWLPDGTVGRPASIAFTDGIRIGAVLDRNGLRPSRYYVTKDDR